MSFCIAVNEPLWGKFIIRSISLHCSVITSHAPLEHRVGSTLDPSYDLYPILIVGEMLKFELIFEIFGKAGFEVEKKETNNLLLPSEMWDSFWSSKCSEVWIISFCCTASIFTSKRGTRNNSYLRRYMINDLSYRGLL